MKLAHCFYAFFCLVALLIAGCQPKEKLYISIDIDIPAPAVTTLNDGRKKLDFVVEVTQLGNHFFQDFDLQFSKSRGSAVLDSFHTLMPTAKEFVRHSVIVDQPGDY